MRPRSSEITLPEPMVLPCPFPESTILDYYFSGTYIEPPMAAARAARSANRNHESEDQMKLGILGTGKTHEIIRSGR